jgi:two-component system, OmpR family, response regulator QseB
MNILLVESEELLGDCIRCGLGYYFFNVMWVKNGLAAWRLLRKEHFDTVILDIKLSDLSVEEILKNMRSHNIITPVIVTGSYNKISDKVKILNSGADDYIEKPFELEELCVRIRIASTTHKHAKVHTKTTIVVNDIVLDTATRKVFKSGTEINLFRREFVLLKILMENAGRAVSRRKILQHLYDWADNISSNALEVHIHNLRKKIGFNVIATLPKEGYIFVKSASN